MSKVTLISVNLEKDVFQVAGITDCMNRRDTFSRYGILLFDITWACIYVLVSSVSRLTIQIV